jgi:hypothetical protein
VLNETTEVLEMFNWTLSRLHCLSFVVMVTDALYIICVGEAKPMKKRFIEERSIIAVETID